MKCRGVDGCDLRSGVAVSVTWREDPGCIMLMVAGGDGDGLRFKEEVSCDETCVQCDTYKG